MSIAPKQQPAPADTLNDDAFFEAMEELKLTEEDQSEDSAPEEDPEPEDRWRHVDTDQDKLEHVGSITITVQELERRKMVRAVQASLAEHSEELAELDRIRPKVRADCAKTMRPCPFVSCRHHLFLDVNPDNGAIKLNFPELEPEADLSQMAETCSLDVAEEAGDEGVTLEVAGALMNITRERTRQIEVAAQEKAQYEFEKSEQITEKPKPAIVIKKKGNNHHPESAPTPANTPVIKDDLFTIDELFD